MKLIDNWKQVLAKAWSVRWLLVANLLGAAPVLAEGLDEYVSPRSMLLVMLIANIAALVSRFIKQDLDKDGAGK